MGCLHSQFHLSLIGSGTGIAETVLPNKNTSLLDHAIFGVMYSFVEVSHAFRPFEMFL